MRTERHIYYLPTRTPYDPVLKHRQECTHDGCRRGFPAVKIPVRTTSGRCTVFVRTATQNPHGTYGAVEDCAASLAASLAARAQNGVVAVHSPVTRTIRPVYIASGTTNVSIRRTKKITVNNPGADAVPIRVRARRRISVSFAPRHASVVVFVEPSCASHA